MISEGLCVRLIGSDIGKTERDNVASKLLTLVALNILSCIYIHTGTYAICGNLMNHACKFIQRRVWLANIKTPT